MELNLKNKSLWVFLFHGFLLFLFLQLGYIGHYGYDDMQYAELANDLLQGKFNFNDHFSYRIIPVASTALAYFIFGVGDFASSFFPMLCSLSILFLVYRIQKNRSLLELSISLSFCLFSPWFLVYSGLLMPDIFLALFFFLSLYVYYDYRYLKEGRNKVKYAFLFALTLFLGFNSKGTIVLILPILAYLFGLDFFIKKDRRFWLNFFAFSIALLFLYFLFSFWITGDFAKRFEAIYNNSYLNHCSYNEQSWQILIKRIGRDLFMLLFRESMLAAFIFLLIAALHQPVKTLLSAKNSNSFWIVSALLALQSSNLMSISISSYNPMCLDARHYLYLVPLLAIPGAFGIKNLMQLHQFRLLFLVLACLFCGLYFIEPTATVYQVYIPLIILVGVFLLVPRIYKKFLALIIGLILLFKPIELIHYANSIDYKKQREFLYSEVIDKKEDVYVITDPVQARLGNYYQGFKQVKQPRFISFSAYEQLEEVHKEAWVLLNRHSLNLAYYAQSELPIYAKRGPGRSNLIASDSSLSMFLFKKEEIVTDSLLYSINDFEQAYQNWSPSLEDLVEKPIYRGNKSLLCRMYGGTFQLEMNSLQLNELSSLYIEVRVFAWTADATRTSLVISLEKDGNSLFYEAKNIQKDLNSYSAWWPIRTNTIIERSLIQAGSTLKVYLYNPDQNTIYLDDFEIKINEVK